MAAIQNEQTPMLSKRPKMGSGSAGSAVGNLANLLPTGTVLLFETLLPSFSNNGQCFSSNKYITSALIICCSLTCVFTSFTDSFMGKDGKLYYGFATFNGLYVFNDIDSSDVYGQEELDSEKKNNCKISKIDFVHAFASLTVFLVFALSNSNVQDCFYPEAAPNEKQLFVNLPLGVGILSSFLFTIFPTTRRGIGYGDVAPTHHTTDSRISC